MVDTASRPKDKDRGFGVFILPYGHQPGLAINRLSSKPDRHHRQAPGCGSGEEWFSCDSSSDSVTRKRKASKGTGSERPSKRIRLNDGYEGDDEENDYELEYVSRTRIVLSVS